jgi:hypothetical protein
LAILSTAMRVFYTMTHLFEKLLSCRMSRMELRRGDKLIGMTDAAGLLGLAQDSLRQQAEDGILRAVKIGRTWVTTEREVERYRREHLGKVGPKPKRPASPNRITKGDAA